MKVKSLSHVQLFVTPWTVAHQVPPSMGFSRQEHWSGLPFPSPMHESEKVKSLSRAHLLATPWTVAHQVPPSMGFLRQEYWSVVPLPSPRDRPPTPVSWASLVAQLVKNLPVMRETWVQSLVLGRPELGISLREGKGYPSQYSDLDNSAVFSIICIFDFLTVKKGNGATWHLRPLPALKACCPSSRDKSMDGFLFLQLVSNSAGLNIYVQIRERGRLPTVTQLISRDKFCSHLVLYTSQKVFYHCPVVQKNLQEYISGVTVQI